MACTAVLSGWVFNKSKHPIDTKGNVHLVKFRWTVRPNGKQNI